MPSGSLLRLYAMIEESVRIEATMTNEYGSGNVTIVDVDVDDNRIYATNHLDMTLCLVPEQVSNVRPVLVAE